MPRVSSTHEKALKLNLESRCYGAFAEIGAGQEVARWFFLVGGAAKTVAKSTSAYDMSVSDAIYGRAQRYVSRQRLEAMLEHELDQIVASLASKRGDTTPFFAFANTVATRRRDVDENGRGWLGIHFQTRPREAASAIIVHSHFLDKEVAREQEAVGILGVNLIYSAYYQRDDLAALLRSLMDDLSRERVEIDMIKLSGPAFAGVDNRLTSLELVEQGLTDAAMFTAAGEVVQPSEVLYKKPILVERGTFRPPTKLTIDLLERARAQFLEEPDVRGTEPVVLAEMTLKQLLPSETRRHVDFLARSDILHLLGIDVLISNFGPYYRLADWLARYTDRKIGMAVGIPTIRDVLFEEDYETLDGGELESVGRLFKRSVKMYAHPTLSASTGRVVTVEDAPLPRLGGLLRDFLLATGQLVPVRGFDPRYLSIKTPEVLGLLQRGDASWESLVVPKVAAMIKEQHLLGCYSY
jgi:hypothetical protein